MAGEEATETTDRLIGEVLANRYQIEHKLGEGAMGAVYRAKHVKVGRAFAVKVLHPKLLMDAKVAQRFEREAELAGRLRHPNVVGVVDVGETSDGLRYMVMDFAEGDDLAALLDEAPFKPERIIHLARQMLEGLYHAHEAGLIHRDFKPENVIIENDDHGAEIVRIVDFGIAILREGGESSSATGRLTTNGLVLGTPHYMAPEQAVADPIDHRIDLFALGIVIYEMLSGKLPFDGSGAEVARANLLLDPPPISERVPYLEVDPLLEAYARRLLAKKRDHRPANAKAARELLDLIDRDRVAAAAALGVPDAAARSPQVTQDVVPHAPPVHEDSGNYMVPEAPPAVAYVPANVPRASQLEAPPVQRREARITTSPADPLPYGEADGEPRRSRRGWIVGALAAAVAAGVVVVAVTRGGDDEAKPRPPEQPLVVQPAPPAPTSPVADKPVDRPVDNVARPADPPIDPPADPPADPPIDQAADPPVDPPADPVAQPTTKPKKPDRVAAREPKPPPVAAKTVDKPAPTVSPPPVEEGVTTDALVKQYSAVGRDLKNLGDKASDLWPKYRLIQLNDAISTPEKRTAAATILTQLQKALAIRK